MLSFPPPKTITQWGICPLLLYILPIHLLLLLYRACEPRSEPFDHWEVFLIPDGKPRRILPNISDEIKHINNTICYGFSANYDLIHSASSYFVILSCLSYTLKTPINHTKYFLEKKHDNLLQLTRQIYMTPHTYTCSPPNFWVSQMKKKAYKFFYEFRNIFREGFCTTYLLLFIMIGSKYNIFDMIVCRANRFR